jgi:hypothetical protein
MTDKERLDRSNEWFDGRTIRYIGHPSMDGKYPLYSVYSPLRGRVNMPAKDFTLRDAIDVSLERTEKCNIEIK